jgi:SAM-dependent methyltransferase
MIQERTHCRICDGQLETVLDMGIIYQSNFLTDASKAVLAPLNLARCTKCNLVQLKHDGNLDSMYRQYWYKSSLNVSMVEALRSIVDSIKSRVLLETGDVVVDIGCNDGTMLSMFPKDVFKIGYDPSLNLADQAQDNCDFFINDYFPANYPVKAKAKVITSIAMFYDLPDPHAFIDKVRTIMRSDGIWVIQFTDLLSMFKVNAFDNICHEHVEYYSLAVLKSLLEQHGFEVVDVLYNKVNGGSVRAYVGFRGVYAVTDAVAGMLRHEDEYMWSFDNPFAAFYGRVERIRERCVDYIRREHNAGKKIFITGASTKGNTLLQYFGINKDIIPYAAEVNADKFGLHTVGTDIEIIPEQQAIKMHPDIFLVLPWHFVNGFIRTYSEYIGKGGRLMVPMPEPVIYGGNNI